MNNDLNGPIYAIVTDNKDPEKQGRVKVSYDLLGENMQSDWLPVMNIYGGIFYIPELESQVIVAFISGNPHIGLVLGNVWTSNQKPPSSGENTGCDFNKDGDNVLRYLITKCGNKLILDDKDGEEKLQLINAKGKNRIEFLAKDKTIKITSQSKITIDAGKNFALQTKKGNLEFKKDLNIKAKEITIETKDELKITANKEVEINGNSTTIN